LQGTGEFGQKLAAAFSRTEKGPCSRFGPTFERVALKMRELAQIRFERAARAAADAKAEEEKQVHEELSGEAEEVAPHAEHVCVPFAED